MKKFILLFLLIPSLCFAVEPIDFSKSIAMSPAILGGSAGGAATCPSYGVELNTTQTATSPSGISEANATTGWTNSGCSSFDQNGTPYSGTYAINLVADSASDKASYALPTGLTNGTVYRLSFWYRHNGTGGAWSFYTGALAGYSTNLIASATSAETNYTNGVLYYITNAVGLSGMNYFVALEASATDNGGVFVDSISVKEATLCYGNELHTNANAASPGVNEANNTTGFTNAGSGSLTSSSDDPSDGTYHLLFAAAANEDRFYVDLSAAPFSLQEGHKYFLRFKAKHVSGDATYCQLYSASGSGGNYSQFPIVSGTTSWTDFGISFVYSALYRYFKCVESGATNNASMKLDSFSVKEITGE